MAVNQNSGHYSSFNTNMQKVLRNQANELALLTAMQQAMVTENPYVTCKFEDNDGVEHTHTMPSYQQLIHELRSVQEVINHLLNGRGNISLGNQTASLKLNHMPQSPANITKPLNSDPTTFTLDPNWFFESFMFPGAVVTIDLKGLVDIRTQQVEVCRIIIDSTIPEVKSLWDTTLSTNEYTYATLLAELNNQNIPYYRDLQTYTLPWMRNKYIGNFTIQDDPQKVNQKIWYYLDTLNYNTISEEGIEQGSNNTLQIGDYLVYDNTQFQIKDIDVNNKAVCLQTIVGAAYPGKDGVFRYYTDPTTEKKVQIRFGINEYNFIFIRAIEPEFGIKSDIWSPAFKFDSDNLIYADSNDTNTGALFKDVYASYILDWGKELIEGAKNKYIQLSQAVTVNPPVITSSDFKVVDVNAPRRLLLVDDDAKQALADYKTSQTKAKASFAEYTSLRNQMDSGEIESTMVATKQSELAELLTKYNNDFSSYKVLQEKLLDKRSELTFEIKSDYHVQGFFTEALSSYMGKDNSIEQQVIQYEIAYRYVSNNSDEVMTRKFQFTNNDGVVEEVETSLWTYKLTNVRNRVLDTATNTYTWALTDDHGDRINQIDIPINPYETVIIKIRSISEAGYPGLCKKSEWSDLIKITAPGILETTIQETIDSALRDSITFEKKYLVAENVTIDEGSVAEKLENLATRVEACEKSQAENITLFSKQATAIQSIKADITPMQESLTKFATKNTL